MIEETVKHLYSLLFSKKYEDIEAFTQGVRMSSAEINECISEYGCKLVPYPEEIALDIVLVEGSDPKEWSVIAPIYTEEEGLSDLSLELSLIDNNTTFYKTGLENIRVR